MEENLVAPSAEVIDQAARARQEFQQTTLERLARLGQWVENHHGALKGLLLHTSNAEGNPNHPICKAWSEMPSTKYLEEVTMVPGHSQAV